MESFDIKTITKSLKSDARALGIPAGAAESFIAYTLRNVQKSLRHKKLITDQDLKRAIVKELKKFNADFAYVYENRDKII